jgi:glycosyltransferase involved in cell wall biosynthesis
MAAEVVLVVPCFNESARLDLAGFEPLLRDGAVRLLFVDDGSTDDTGALLTSFAARQPERVELLGLPRNQGKAEAVRQGMLAALRSEPAVVGYVDADLATPAEELLRLVGIMRGRPPLQALIGARVGLLGSAIERRALRHYFGRVFATAASIVLRLRIYDTQCGAKLFRPGPALQAALAEPFISRWVFDVELIGRLLLGAPGVPPVPIEALVEEPLRAWRDVAGSKVKPLHVLGVAGDLVLIERDFRRRKRSLAASGAPG